MLRIGHGYDVHRLVEGRRCIIGGVDIPHNKGLLGHSDADVLAHALAVLRNERFGGQVDAGAVAVAALYHDASEILTGDLPTPIKYYNPAIRDAYKQVESVAAQKLLDMLPADLRPAYDEALSPSDPGIEELVSAADKLSAHIKCLEELKAGNSEFKKAAEQTRAALERFDLPELRCFCEEFLPSFELALDEMD